MRSKIYLDSLKKSDMKLSTHKPGEAARIDSPRGYKKILAYKEGKAMNIEKKIKKANRKLAKIILWFRENREKFGYTNYKLYEAAFYDYREDFPLTTEEYDSDSDPLFYQWCEMEWCNFEEWQKQENIEYKPDYIGRTSTFKVHEDVVLDRYDRLDTPSTIYELLDNLYCGCCGAWVEFTQAGLVDRLATIEAAKEYPESVEGDLDYIITSFFQDIKKHFEDALIVRDYIDSMKEHQVEWFKEWLSVYEEELTAEKEEEAADDQREYISRLAWLRTFTYDKEAVLGSTPLSSETLQKLALAH